MISLWFIFALLSLASLSGSEISQKISLTQKINISAITNNFVVWSLQGIGGLIMAFFLGQLNNPSFPVDKIPQLLAVAIVYFLGGTFFYTSYKSNSPSISIILGSISIVISTTLGIIFLNEPRAIAKFIGIALILTSIIILNLHKENKVNKYNIFALLGGLCFGVAYTLDKSLVLVTPPAIYVSILSFSVALASIVFQGKRIILELRNLKVKNYYPMVTSATFGTLFNFFTFSSYHNGGNVGAVDAINSSNVFLVIILEIFLLKDKNTIIRKVSCAFLAVIGLIILSTIK